MKKAREYVSSKEISKIDLTKTQKIKGSFLLGSINPKTGKFLPRYVGVSFTDLMKEIVNASKLKANQSFDRYRLVKTKTDKEAWELECKTFHEFKEVNNLTNESHSKWNGKEKLTCPNEACK